MSYARAKLIIWNPKAYDRKTVHAAVVWILATLEARQEDIDQAIRVY